MKVITIGKPGGHRFNVTPYVDLCSHKSLQLLSAAGRVAERDSCEQAEFAYANGRLKGVERMVVRVDEPLGEPWFK